MDTSRKVEAKQTTIMPEEYRPKTPVGGVPRRSIHDSPELVFQSEQARGIPAESSNRDRRHFYARPEVERSHMSSETDSVPGEAKEFLFPVNHDQRASIMSDFAMHSRSLSSNPSPFPRSSHRFRAHSVSVTNPVCKSSYASLPQSPATSFLAQFAEPDDYGQYRDIQDGSIVDKYQVGKVIGRGSFSECREAICIQEQGNEVRVAMKIVKSDETQGHSLEDFDRELSVWQRLKHKNILPLIDCIQSEGVRIAISPVADNGSLLDYITTNGPFTEAASKVIFRQIVEAVLHMHNDHEIIHRDIKLDNILLDHRLHPYLCDFGLCEAAGRKGSTADEFSETESCQAESQTSKARSEGDIYCKGSLWYIPPEELDPSLLKACSSTTDSAGYGKKADVWALGVVLYGMISGRLPFTDDFIPRLQVSVTTGKYAPLPEHYSSKLKDIIARLLTVDVQKRPDVEDILEHEWLST